MNSLVSVGLAGALVVAGVLCFASGAGAQDTEQDELESSLDALVEELKNYDDRLREIAEAEKKLEIEKDLVTRAAISIQEKNDGRIKEIEHLYAEVEAKRDDVEKIFEQEQREFNDLVLEFNAECAGTIPETKLPYCTEFGERVDKEHERVEWVWEGLQQIVIEARDAATEKIEALEKEIEEDATFAAERIEQYVESVRVWEERKYAVTTLRLRALLGFLSHPIMAGIRESAGDSCLELDTPEALHNCEAAFYDEAKRRGVLEDGDVGRGTTFFGIGQ